MAPQSCAPTSELEALVNGFDRDPLKYRALFDTQIALRPEKFYAEAIEILRADTESRGANYLVTLLLSNDFLLRAVCDPALDRKQATRLLKEAIHIDPMLDVKLLRILAASIDSGSAAVPRGAAGRLLDILGDLAPINRMLASLARLFRHSDPYVRSKAVLMVGRANHSARWAMQRLNDPDTRIRASAVEGLWGAEGDDVREVLRGAAADPNNRVAGNAVLGLYRLGEVSTILEIQTMATNPSMLFRSTAAWIMGETNDMRFQECVAGMLRDSSPMVRKRAFAALRKIKDAAAGPQPAEWAVAARISANDPQKATRRLLVAVMADTKQQPTLLGTQFLLTENGRAVHSYKVAERPLPESLPVAFLFPRTAEQGESVWLQGALSCLRMKRTSDFWACEQFLSEGPCEAVPSADAVAFHSNAGGANAALRRHPQKTDCADVWHTMWRVLQGESSGVRGRRHVILFNPSKSPDAPALDFAQAFLLRGSLQVISLVHDASLEALCAKVGGTFDLAASEEQVPRLITSAYLRLLGRYELIYRPSTAAPADMRVRIQHPSGWGETAVAMPPQATN